MTANGSEGATGTEHADSDEADDVRVWLVERTYGDDELNIIILVYATEDGRRYHRRERALTSFSGPVRETKAGLCVPPEALGSVDDPDTQARYAEEASRMAARHEPDDTV
ncbi:hypothetical protein E2L06_08580 [Haloterrigena sp. H1]|uniref:hypothetical protein n=1 Tax=Haloterrigena sp. H1 TaxID=2552943 RepID=UPI00110F61DF|nr:hypothetical protein [Haloterrigena sp. H1]TMT86648.1 hypothetical protein E2L06_08580 [Haloterrigena sp. H1]